MSSGHATSLKEYPIHKDAATMEPDEVPPIKSKFDENFLVAVESILPYICSHK